MTEAPESPTIHELRQAHGIKPETELAVIQAAEKVSASIENHEHELIGIIGGCSMTSHQQEIEAEGRQIASLANDRPGLHMLHRIPPWKPRSKKESWHGEETTNPAGAYRTLASLATSQTNVAIEVGSREHIDRYGPMLTFGWIGSRNAGNTKLTQELAIRDPKLPLGIKNAIDGSIDSALEQVDLVKRARTAVDNPAPAILIFRGGTSIRTPKEWEKAYRRALETTEGKLIVDTAHGSEMAHDPEQMFKKSVAGQIAAIEAVLRLAEVGYVPAGIMIEASDIESPVDPTIPLQVALDGVKRLYQIKTGNSQQFNWEEKVTAA
jgi:phospho-2-dehydro-3-deoxyheptonate aldolase